MLSYVIGYPIAAFLYLPVFHKLRVTSGYEVIFVICAILLCIIYKEILEYISEIYFTDKRIVHHDLVFKWSHANNYLKVCKYFVSFFRKLAFFKIHQIHFD